MEETHTTILFEKIELLTLKNEMVLILSVYDIGYIYKYPFSYMYYMYIHTMCIYNFFTACIYNFLTACIYNFLCSETGLQPVTVSAKYKTLL